MTYEGFWLRVGCILEGSLFGRLFLRIVHAVGGAFHASFLYSFFTSKSMEDYGKSSAVFRAIRRFFSKSRLRELASQSFFVRAVCGLPDLFFCTRLSALALYFLSFGTLLFINSYGNIGLMICFAALIVAGVLLLCTKCTVGDVCSGSRIVGSLCRFFGINAESEKKVRYYKSAIAAFALGCVSGGASFFVGAKLSALAFAAFALLPVLIASPLLLILLTLFCGLLLSTFPAFALAVVTVVVVVCRLLRGKEHLPRLRAVYIMVFVYMLLTAYYTLCGSGGNDSVLAGLIQFVFLLFFFAVVAVISTKDKLRRLVSAISVCTVYTGLLGVYQRFMGQGGTAWSDDKDYVGGLKRISGTFANPNVYGEFIIFAICIIIVALLLSKNMRQRLFFFACLALQVANLGFTYSRGCYIAVALAVILIIWCCDKRILSAGIFAIPLLPYVLPQNVLARIMSVTSYLEDSSVTYRFSIWEACMRLIGTYWYAGAGIGTVAFTNFYQLFMIGGVTAQHSHNTLMQITIELSIVALLLMLLIAIFLIRDAGHTLRGDRDISHKFITIPFMAALLGVMLEGMVDYIFYNNIIYMFFWTVLALAVCGLNIVSAERKEELNG